MNTRAKGAEYEQIAAEYLQNHGVRVIERNYRNRRGEIDIIGLDGEYTVFVEVKYRKSNINGSPAEAVNFKKQKTICKVADYYRVTHGMGEFSAVRYDVVAVQGTEICWIQNAFPHIYTR